MNNSKVLHRTFFSKALEKEKKYCIYLPPGYAENIQSRYSSVYLLPGLMDWERTWFDKGHVAEAADDLLEQGRIGPMIIVTPDKDDEALDAESIAFATYLTRDLIEHIDSSYRTISARAHRGIEGLSLGAGWAMRAVLYRPDLYSAVGCLSGGFDASTYEGLLRRYQELKARGTRFRVGVGLAEEECLANNKELVRFVRELGFYCELDVADGPHDWELWEKQALNSLQFQYYSFNPK